MDPTTFHNLVTYNWDLHDAGFRAMQAVHQSIYNAQTQQPVTTPESFLSQVQWPAVRPYIPGGSSSATAGGDDADDVAGEAAGDDDEFRDQQAADAFMDEDDDGEDDDAASDEEAVDEDSISDDF
jgi:hypothetical protein